jgi:hypothetical protein
MSGISAYLLRLAGFAYRIWVRTTSTEGGAGPGPPPGENENPPKVANRGPNVPANLRGRIGAWFRTTDLSDVSGAVLQAF